MKAVQINEYGGPDVIKITTDTPEPVPSSSQVLVEVHAASLNPFDTMVREGHVAGMIKSLPITLGGDIAGVVKAVGSDVASLKPGDEVYGQANVVAGNSGAFAEFAATAAAQVALKPKSIDFVQAGALPLTGVSALQALTEHIKLQSGQKLLIQGGSGGIGSLAIQIAKSLGAYVAATAPTEAVEFVKSLGADEVIDYKTQKFEELIRDYDAVFDTVGGDVFTASLRTLKRGGIGVSMIAQADEQLVEELGVTAISQMTHVTTDKLEQLAQLVDGGKVQVHVDKTFPLDQAAEAFRVRESGSSVGKIVLNIK